MPGEAIASASNLRDPETWLREQEQRSAHEAEQAQQVAAVLAEIRGTATSADGAVTATVSPGGQLLDVQFTARADGLTPTKLRASILEANQRAQAAAARQRDVAMVDLLGEGSEALAFLRTTMPPPEQETATTGWGPRHDDDTYAHGR